jgi:tetratricopeptide (TPR) repeat protein
MQKSLNDQSIDTLTLVQLANAYYIAGEKERAFSVLKRALDLNPYDTEPIKAIAILEIKEAMWDEAMEFLQTAVRLDPFDPILYFNMGLVEFQRGNLQKARSHLERGLGLAEDLRARELLKEVTNRLRGRS